jgi:hypothetical protein
MIKAIASYFPLLSNGFSYNISTFCEDFMKIMNFIIDKTLMEKK